ncbi:unnamed protein product [Brassica oleracea]|uniref:Uncharacterized protein n=1 Tax=Brassica oleracea var. oleracea TaxID=109376 RepID=A0A0D3CTN1_BRAOL
MFDTTAMEDARQLAKELKKLERGSGGGSIWGVVSRVWVELICYAANHCESKQHAAHLSKDGEIVSFVWLLMAHMGLVCNLPGVIQISHGIGCVARAIT